MPLIATRGAASAQGFGEFAQSGPVNYIEDVFSTYLYTGTGSTQTITNGINLSGIGGMVWTKGRSVGENHGVSDTVRGANATVTNNNGALITNGTSSGSTAGHVTAFNSNGFTLGTSVFGNGSGTTYVSWTFAKQPKFFDVVTYTGTGSTRSVSHSLNSIPGCIIIKCTSNADQWMVYHRSLGTSKFLYLNTTGSEQTFSWISSVGSTSFTLEGGSSLYNDSGRTYVAYLFAHDAGGFGLTGSDNVISCGSFTTNASGIATVTLGYEPQWVLIKRTDSTSEWHLLDNMRGFSQSTDAWLRANSSAAEDSTYAIATPTATGFVTDGTSIIDPSSTFIYIAIRRGPMKTPTTGTSVYAAATGLSTSPVFVSGFPTDFFMEKRTASIESWYQGSRLTGSQYMSSNNTNAEVTGSSVTWDYMNGAISAFAGSTNYFGWMFRRAPGFFDVVCYTGNGPGTQTINHNLGVVPELVINKTRSSINGWTVFQGSTTSLTGFLRLNTDNAKGGDTLTVSSTSITADSTIGFGMNTNGTTYVTYLFASCPGVSKVGSYTGTGTTLQVNCGFTGGARFVLIKRTDSTGDWYVWDSARGIVAGNDPYLLLNSAAAEVTNTDYVDTYSAGFEISSTAPAAINANGGTFIFLAIA